MGFNNHYTVNNSQNLVAPNAITIRAPIDRKRAFGKYIRQPNRFANLQIHTQGIEGYWSLVRSTLRGRVIIQHAKSLE